MSITSRGELARCGVVEQLRSGVVEFRVFRPEARGVFLAGEFNSWKHDGMPMAQAGAGWWVYRLRLAPGVYQFKYIADGEWLPDYAAFGLEPGPFGSNSVLLVREPHPAPAGKPDAGSLRSERSGQDGERERYSIGYHTSRAGQSKREEKHLVMSVAGA